jgi:hypothetical protein
MRVLALAAMLGVAIAGVATADTSRPANKPAHTAFDDRPENHGQIVSGCNHRAKDRELIGIDRQDYVEWCTSRGYRYDRSHMDSYWDDDRNCYGQANDRGMTGDRRAEFLGRCLDRDDDRRHQ